MDATCEDAVSTDKLYGQSRKKQLIQDAEQISCIVICILPVVRTCFI